MELLPEYEKIKIRTRAKKIKNIFKNPITNIFVFQTIGAMILSFGVCVSEYTHPISRRIVNPFWGFLICCFNYFAISISGLFTGGHINPSASITLSVAGIVQNPKRKLPAYFASQLIGSLLGALLYYAFFQETTQIYKKQQDIGTLLMDSLSEIFGTFVFCFGVLHITKSQYMKGQPFKYFYISLMLFVARMFTFRKGCLNPAIAISFQIFAAGNHQNFALFYYVIWIIIGEIIGAVTAAIFYNKFYEPLLIEVQKHSN